MKKSLITGSDIRYLVLIIVFYCLLALGLSFFLGWKVSLAMVPLIALLAVSFFWSVTLNRKYAERTRALRERTAELSRSNSQLFAILESSTEGLVIADLQGKLFHWNPAALAMHGFSNIEEAKRKLAELTGIFELSTEDEGILPLEKWPLNRILNAEELRNWEVKARRLDKEWSRVFNYGGTLARDKDNQPILAVVTVSDITERKQAEEALRQSELRYKSIITTTLDGFWQIDLCGRFLDVNDGECRMIGYTREEFLKMRIADIEVVEGAAEVENHIGIIKKKGADRFDSRHRRKDGQVIDVAISTNFVQDERGERIYAFVRDITYRKQVEEELNKHRQHLEELVGERTRELRETQEKLLRIERLSALGRLAAMVGHELRNPLGVIRNSVYFLKMKLSKELQKEEKIGRHLDILEEEVGRSDRIINDILTYGGIKEPQMSRIDLSALIDRVIKKCLIPPGIDLQLELGPGRLEIRADENQLTHLFTNIILNALEAMPKGGSLAVSTQVKDKNIEVRVKDTGVGIKQENLPKIFDPDFSTKPGGTGLGLSISQSVVHLHNGRIDVQSRIGEGTEFTIVLPVNNEGA